MMIGCGSQKLIKGAGLIGDSVPELAVVVAVVVVVVVGMIGPIVRTEHERTKRKEE